MLPLHLLWVQPWALRSLWVKRLSLMPESSRQSRIVTGCGGTGGKSLGEILRNTIFREGTYLLVLVVGLRGVVPPPAPAHLLLRVGAAAGLARHLGLWPRTCADIYPRHEVALGLI